MSLPDTREQLLQNYRAFLRELETEIADARNGGGIPLSERESNSDCPEHVVQGLGITIRLCAVLRAQIAGLEAP